MSVSRLTEICDGLLRDGLIRESEVVPATGNGRGRPRTLLELDLQSHGVGCVRYEREHVTGAVVDLAGSVRWRQRRDGPFETDAKQFLRRICEALKHAVKAASGLGIRLVAAGASDPGTVNVATGGAIRAVNVPGWHNVPVVTTLRAAAGLPVVLERSDGWEALGEVAFGAGRGAGHVLFVTLLEGVGGAIVDGGKLLAGRDGSAGEIGHTRVSDGGPPCGCGGRGCLEAYLAPARLAALWRGMPMEQAYQVPLAGEAPDDDFARMLRAASDGDWPARKVLTDAAHALARGLGNAISLLNPERIVLGGRFVQAGRLFVEPLRQALPAYALGEFLQGVDVRLAELGEESACLGVAAYVRDRMFAYPNVGAGLEGAKRPASSRREASRRP